MAWIVHSRYTPDLHHLQALGQVSWVWTCNYTDHAQLLRTGGWDIL